MHSINMKWKKQMPSAVKIPARKIAPIQQPSILNNTEPNLTGTVRSNRRLLNEPSFISLPEINPVLKSANSSTYDIQSYHDKRLCSVRTGIATFIIIVLVIVVAAIAIGIVFGVIKGQNSSGSGNNNQNSLVTIPTGSLTSSVSIGSQTGLPCSGYTLIDDPTRSSSHVGSYSNCDNNYLFNTSNGGAWIRFVGSGGTQLPLSSPGVNHCGGFLAGWYNDTLPVTPNTITNGTVCFETYTSTCSLTVNVSVILCSPGSYYAFFLPPLLVCNARYCTA